MTLRMIDGSLLDAPERFVCHQCNCVTHRAAHLAAAVFRRFPWADIYSPRRGREVPVPDEAPGRIVVRGDGADRRFVIAILGQYYPGRPRYPDGARDGFAARRRYFAEALDRIAAIPDLDSVAFPHGIGCGAAGGDWTTYEAMIADFARRVDAEVVIYRLRGGAR